MRIVDGRLYLALTVSLGKFGHKLQDENVVGFATRLVRIQALP